MAIYVLLNWWLIHRISFTFTSHWRLHCKKRFWLKMIQKRFFKIANNNCKSFYLKISCLSQYVAVSLSLFVTFTSNFYVKTDLHSRLFIKNSVHFHIIWFHKKSPSGFLMRSYCLNMPRVPFSICPQIVHSELCIKVGVCSNLSGITKVF